MIRGMPTNKEMNRRPTPTNNNPNDDMSISSSTTRSRPAIPPSEFSPPHNVNKRSAKVDVVLTANANSRPLSSSLSNSQSPFSVGLPTHNCTMESFQKREMVPGGVHVSGGDGKRNLGGRKIDQGNKERVCNKKTKSSLRKGSQPTTVTSIAVDFDLAAKEDDKSTCENDNAFSQQPNHETIKQIDAVMTSGHEDDTDLGFDFSPSRNDDCLSNMYKESPMSQSIARQGSFNLGLETPSKRASTESLPLPSPPKPPAFRQQHMGMKQERRPMHMPLSGANPRHFPHPHPHPYGHHTPRSYSNHQSFQSHASRQSFGQKAMYHPPGPRYPHNSNDNILNYQSQSNKNGPKSSNHQYYHLAPPQSQSQSNQPRVNKRVDKGGNIDLSSTLSPGRRDRRNTVDKGEIKKTLLRSPPPKKRRVVGSWDENSRKKDIDVIPLGSPSNVFRSPKSQFKRSPLLSKASMSFGGSFDEMFPPSSSFEFGENLLTDDIILNSDDPKKDPQHKKIHASPNLMFDTVLSPLKASPTPKRSVSGDRPVLSSSLNIFDTFEASPLPLPKQTPIKSVQRIGSLSLPTKQQLGRGHDAARHPKKSNITFPSPGSFRIQLGPVGSMHKSDPKNEIEGTSTGVNGRNFQNPLVGDRVIYKKETPMKTDRVVVSTPSTEMKIPGYSNRTQIHPPVSVPRVNFMKMSSTPPTPVKGKENQSPQQPRRNPCNCKKSNCLKLYCVCFQAKLYCDGCNCVDCNNTKDKEEIRQKAIKDTVAKNPNAFKPRFSSKKVVSHDAPNPNEGHNIGCKCKKSQCLKKYCECFEAGVTCSDKCKCVECQNYVGSQQLIDRRRKIKDHKGAEMAMRSSHDAWKNGLNHNTVRGGMHHPTTVYPSPAQTRIGQAIGMYPMTMISPSPPGPGGAIRPGSIPPHFMGRSQMVMTSMGYSPHGMQPVTPAYTTSKTPQGSDGKLNFAPNQYNYYQQRSHRQQHNTRLTKRAPTRKKFDVQCAKKRLSGDQKSKHSFGKSNVAQNKLTSLIIFSFLSNDDIYNASLVCKDWNKLSLDEELWQYDKQKGK